MSKTTFDIVRICGIDFRRWKDGGTSTEALLDSVPFGMMWRTVPDAIARIIFADQEALIRLKAELDEAREVLKPFAEALSRSLDLADNVVVGASATGSPYVTVLDLRRARAFLDRTGK